MADVLAWLALAAVILGLVASAGQQFRQLGPRGAWLDALALVPQWRFFGQNAVGNDPAWLDDWHVLARLATNGDDSTPQDWHPVAGHARRTWWHWAWNPHARSRSHLLAFAERLGNADRAMPVEPTGLAYLAILHACLAVARPGENQVVQFALVTTRGCDEPSAELRYLSLWHVR